MENKRAAPICSVRNKCAFLTAFWSFLYLFTAIAQPGLVHTAYYSLDDGLSSREVRSIFQDDQGFIWLGTAAGVDRFDGYHFENFDNLTGTEFKISDDDVVNLGLTKNKELLIQYNNNFIFFDLLNLNTYQTTKVTMLPEDGIDGFAQDIHLTDSGEIFVLSLNDKGTDIYHYRCGEPFEKVTHIDNSHKKKTAPVSFFRMPSQEFLINDSENGLMRVSPNGELLQTWSARELLLSDEEAANYPGKTTIFHQDRQGRVWISFNKTPGILSLLPADLGAYEATRPEFLPQQKTYNYLWEDKQGNLLIAEPKTARAGNEIAEIFCLKPDGTLLDFSHIIPPRQQTTALYSANFFSTIFYGLDTGFKIVQNNQSTVRTFLQENIPEDQRGAIIRGITGDGKSKIYVAREQYGWYVLDLKTDFLDTLQIVDRQGFPITIDCSMDLHLDEAGFLWGFTCKDGDSGLLLKYDTANCYAEIFTYPQQFTAMTPTADGGFWLTASSAENQGELVRFDRQTGLFQQYFTREGENPLKNAYPYYLIESRSGPLYIGTKRGLYALDPNTDTLSVYQRAEEGQTGNGLRSDDIIAIHEDADGKIWLGTTNGLSILDPVSGQIRTLDRLSGLPSNVVCGILPDGQGNYWISTYNGISFYSPEYGVFRKFYSADGFAHNEFNRFSFYRDHRGRFYFGGVNGLNAFYPRDLIIATTTPSPRLTQITRFSSRSDSTIVQKTGLRNLDCLEINPYDSYFQVHFMLPDFSRTDKNQFSAWLEGYEPGWSNLGSSPFVRYSNLPAGKYTLHINGADPNGNPSQNPIRLDIRVRPRFYTTWWFILCGAILLVAIAYGLFRYQLDQQLRMERLRTRLSSDIHDEVSGLLSGIAMQADVLREVNPDSYVREKLLSIGETSRKAMSKMSDIIWSTDSRKDRMSDLIERMREHADDMLLNLNIPYDFRIEKVDQSRKIPVHIRQNLYFIYKEAINNIAKHADAHRVNIRLANQGNNFQMMIHNDGHTRQNGSKKGGQGLSNIKMRAQRINANVDIFNHDGFTIKVIMKKFV